MSANMERIMRNQPLSQNQMMHHMRNNRILEVNPDNPIIASIKQSLTLEKESEKKYVNDMVNLIYEVAVVNSGFSLDDPSAFSKRIFNIIKMSLSLDDDVVINELNSKLQDMTLDNTTGGVETQMEALD